MTKTTYEFTGKVRYAHVLRPNKYGKYSVNFYPASSDDRKAVKATGVRNGIKEDENGEFYYVFRNDIAPSVTDAQGGPVTVLIGDGSTATLQLEVETFTSKQYGEVTRSKLIGMIMRDLIPYVPKTEAVATTESADLPA